jgi:hypothetical protein
MWMTIISFIGGPVIKGLIDAYQAKLKAGNVSERIAADTAGQEIAAQTAETQAITQLKIAQIGHWYEPEKLFAYSLWFYFTKVYIYDAALGFGTTDAVRGDVATWGGLVISFYFAKRGFENVARILKR